MRHHFALAGFLMLGVAACGSETSSSPSTTVRIDEAGWSFGFCLGPCRGELQLDDTGLTYRVTDRTGGQQFAANRGSLTSQGKATLDSLASALPESLLETYGCPDCADAGAGFLVITRDNEAMRTTYELPSPPSVLASTHAFLRSVMDALGGCMATDDVTLETGCQALPD